MIEEHSLRSLLAADDGVSIEICDCGTIHLTIGAITLRLPREVLATMARVTAEAVRRTAPTRDEPLLQLSRGLPS